MRHLFANEIPLVEFLFELASIPLDAGSLTVHPKADGGMGSLAIVPVSPGRRFGSQVAECHFPDEDGTPVSVTLNVDQGGDPFEIDVWRVDFSRTLAWPSRESIMAGPPN
jgi:hypothetical protein